MKKVIFALLIVLISSSFSFSQSNGFQLYDPPIPLINNGNSDWGIGDWIVSASQPLGRPSGVFRTSNNNLYVAIPDTGIQPGKDIVILRSSNNGVSWSVHLSHSGTATDVKKTKFVDAGNDSLYLFYMVGSTVYTLNIITYNFNTFTAYTNIRDWDAATSASHAIHLIIDLIGNNDIRQYASTNGGVTWSVSQYISSTGATPRIAFNSTGDTCILNYYAALTADTGSSAIRNFRFRESTPGTLVSLGFTDPITAGVFKDQFQPVLFKGKAWLFYTTGTTGNINLNCIQSDNGGSTYGTPFTIGSLPSRDEYWFDAKYFTYGSGGADLIWYSDTAQVGAPTNTTDRLYYAYFNYSTPTSYGTPAQINEHWPFWSSRMYIPSIIEFYNTSGDMGAIWVGGPSPYKLYFDRGAATTRISNNQTEIPAVYSLSQNYPNPFNPVTKIDFSIPKNGFVTITIYDIMGKEVDVLTNKLYPVGNYSVEYNASKLSSGVYFYKLTSGSYSDTKKMILVK